MYRTLLALGIGIAVVLACGPRWNHVHIELEEPLPSGFDVLMEHMFISDQSVTAKDWNQDYVALLLADQEADSHTARRALRPRWLALQDQYPMFMTLSWRQVIAGHVEAADPRYDNASIEDHRRCHQAGWRIADAWYLWHHKQLHVASTAFAHSTLISLSSDHHPLQALALRWRIIAALHGRELDLAAQLLTQLKAVPDLSATLRDEIAWFDAWTAVIAFHSLQTRDAAARDALRASLQLYLDAHPQGTWRADVLGWQAYLDYHQPAQLETAIATYQQLITDKPPGGYLIGRDSLKLAYRRYGDEAPAVVRSDLRFEAAFHARRFDASRLWYSPRRNPEKYRAMSELAEAALLAPGREMPTHPMLVTLLEQRLAIGDGPEAKALLDRIDSDRDAHSAYLRLRHMAEHGDSEQAFKELETYYQRYPNAPNLRDLCLRVGSAREAAGDHTAALRCYVRGNGWMDVAIHSDGIMPIDDLRVLVDSDTDLTAWPSDVGRVQGRRPEAGFDYRPELRERLGVRLVRHGHIEEALPYLSGKRLAATRQLLALEQAAAAADATPDDHYALGAFWYHRGVEVLVVDRHWHQWLSYLSKATPADDREMELMTGCWRARETFTHIYQTWPNSPEAPRAMYSAALCNYWLCQPKKALMGVCAYWERRAKRDALFAEGDMIMQDLRLRYPEHPLANSTWVRRDDPPPEDDF